MTHRPKLRRFGRLAASAAFTWLIALAAAKAQTPDLDACGRASDSALRIKACSAVIGAPGNPPAMIAWAYANRCQALENSRSFDAAIADCSQALKVDPNMANAYNLRGFAYYAKGDSDRALADYDAALRLVPDNAYAHAARGHIYLAKRDYGRAIQEFDAALALTPTDAWTMASRGYAYSLSGDNDHALQDLQAAVKLDPKGVLARLRLAEVMAVAGQADQALALDQGNPAALPGPGRGGLSRALPPCGDPGQCGLGACRLQPCAQLQPKDGLARAYRGYAHFRGGESDAAIADYTAALATKPHDAPSLYGRGAAHAAKAEMDAASQDIAAARAADPKIDALMARLHVTAPPGLAAGARGAGRRRGQQRGAADRR